MHRPKIFDPPWINFFKRPCPYYLKQHTTFPKFPMLPKELQLMIWSHFKPEPRAIYLKTDEVKDVINTDGSENNSASGYLIYRQPGILSASYEARVAGLKLYQPFMEFLHSWSTVVYFRSEIDYLQLDFELIPLLRHRLGSAPAEKNDLPNIQKLVVVIKDAQMEESHLVQICRIFTGLSMLFIIEKDSWYTMDGVPYAFLQKQKSFRHDWTKLRRQIRAPVTFIRDRLTSWTPPTLVLGSRSQWKGRRARVEEREQFERHRDKVARGEMEWQEIAIFPRLDYVPMYQEADPRMTYNMILEQGPVEEKKQSKDLVTANIFNKEEECSDGEEMDL